MTLALPGAAGTVEGPHLVIPTFDGLHVAGSTVDNPFYFNTNGKLAAVAGPVGVAGTANTAGTEASLLPTGGVVTIPAGFWSVGRTLRIRATGLISCVITTPGTARFKVKLGPTANITVFDSLAVLLDPVAHTAKGWDLEIELTCRSIGSGTSATLWGTGKFTSEVVDGVGTMPLGALVAMLPWNSTPAAGTGFDSTAASLLDLTFTQTVATGSCTLETYYAQVVAG